jgi:HJR/Mrr/RecB family endonuclease
MPDSSFAHAIAAIRAGRRAEGQALLKELLANDPHDIKVLFWMTEAADTASERRDYLKHILEIDPTNELAIRGLKLVGESATIDSSITPKVWDLDNLDGLAFEALVMQLLKKMGLQVQETKRTGDGGIDIVARSPEPITGGFFVVQCKRYASNIGEPIVRDLYGVINHVNASKGILITNSHFSRQAYAFAEGKPIELINGDLLRELLAKYGFENVAPKGKRFLQLSSKQKRLFDGLERVGQKIRTMVKVDAVLVDFDTKPCSMHDFLEIGDRLNIYFDQFKNIAAIIAMSNEYSDETTVEEVDYQLAMIRKLVDEMLKSRRIVMDWQAAPELASLKRCAVDLYTTPLVQLADFFVNTSHQMEEVDHTFVDDGYHPGSALQLDIEQETAAFIQELNRMVEAVRR